MSGYIGNIPVPQATQTRDTFTATAGQTSFATSGYTPSFLDVFLNGVHLVNGTDYTATNGSDVVLSSGATSGDSVEVVAYSTYQVNDQAFTGDFSVDSPTFVVDSTNNWIGIGTSSPSALIQVEAADGASGGAIKYTATAVASGYMSANPDGLCLATDTAGITFRTGISGNDPTDTGTERMRIDSNGNAGINASDPDVNSTSAKLLHIAGTAVNSGPAGFMMTGSSAIFGQAFCSTEVFGLAGISSATEICRFTGTGANGYQAYFRIVVTGHTSGINNGTNVKEYVWGGGTTSPTQISSATNGSVPVISFDNTTANVCIIKVASSNGTSGFNGAMKVEWLNPIDFASSTYTVS